ncbi:Crp/Fnr family transcriptional regulator [Tenacibaculum sp. E3R01]|uniref:Crp/Fnr family transcriptional regulator n=1 Tax=Tenacibaculum sp. E3R01 TaxID=2267227 RepID=UPI000DEB58E3|nr:Crp/Fnr family transcriptional regulator [Tenacibaculum sp. E3R01]RBW59487.1 Crp/Fnr family transcriptional regulator [Tenacibaculum sp. E3R01]
MEFNLLLKSLHKHIELSKEEEEFFVSLVSYKKITKKEKLLISGGTCLSKFFVVKGCIRKYYINTEGKERVFEFGIENQWILDMQSFWKETSSIYTIEAIENTEVFELKRSDIDKLLIKVPKFERYFRLLGNEMLYKKERRIKQSLSCSAKERYNDFLSDYPKIELRLSQRQIASYLGVSPEFLSSLRNKNETTKP